MIDPSSDGLIDLIYEAALDPDLWVGVMQRFTDYVGGDDSVMTQLDVATGAGIALPTRSGPEVMDKFFAHYVNINPLQITQNPDEYVRSYTPKIITDQDWVPREDLIRTEYYNDFLRPIKADWSMMIRLDLQGRSLAAISIARRLDRGQYGGDELEAARKLHPHLIRSYALSRKLTLDRSARDDVAEALDGSDRAVFILDDTGLIRHLNQAADRLLHLPMGLRVVSGRLSATFMDAGARLSALIGDAGSRDADRRRGGVMRLRLPNQRLPMSISVSPMRSEAFSVVSHGPAVLVCVSDPNTEPYPVEARLKDHFALTAAESRVALALFEGRSSQEIAAQFGVSINTVRVQIRSIFTKTGARRQSDLVRLMTPAASPAAAVDASAAGPLARALRRS